MYHVNPMECICFIWPRSGGGCRWRRRGCKSWRPPKFGPPRSCKSAFNCMLENLTLLEPGNISMYNNNRIPHNVWSPFEMETTTVNMRHRSRCRQGYSKLLEVGALTKWNDKVSISFTLKEMHSFLNIVMFLVHAILNSRARHVMGL